jgi:hypothetical protein
MQDGDELERAARAAALAQALDTAIGAAWERRAALAESCPDPVVLVLQGDDDNDAPEAATVVIRSAALIGDEIELFAPEVTAHLPHVDTRDPTIIVVMSGGLHVIHVGAPCKACRLDVN